MEPSDTANKVCPQQMAGRQNVEEFEVLARGLFSRTVVSVEYRPGRPCWQPSVEALIDRAWQTYLHTNSDAGITVYNGALFRLESFMQTDGRLRLMLSDADFRGCIGTASAEFTSAFPDLPRTDPLTVSAVLITGDGKIVVERGAASTYAAVRTTSSRASWNGSGTAGFASFRYSRKGGARGVRRGQQVRV